MLSDVERGPEGTTGPEHAQAAQHAPVAGSSVELVGETTRRRVSWAVLVPVVTAGAGLMFAMSFKTARGGDLRADRDLPALILEGDARNKEKGIHVDELAREVDQLSKVTAQDTRLSALAKTNEQLAPLAATTRVRGPAIEVTLDDSPRGLDSLPRGFDANALVVHQEDVQSVVNTLWSTGAEAMMIQDQRVISTSAVRCVGNTLILQGRVYAPPYKITAIGNLDKMQQALDSDLTIQTYRQYVDAVGLGYEVQHLPEADFPAYSGSVDLQHARALR